METVSGNNNIGLISKVYHGKSPPMALVHEVYWHGHISPLISAKQTKRFTLCPW